MLKSINPHSLHTLKIYDADSRSSIEEKIDTVHKAYLNHRQSNFQERSKILNHLHDALLSNAQGFATLMASEMGKPIQQGISEIEKCAWVCQYYAEHGPQFLKNLTVVTDAKNSFVSFQPFGVVLAIMPWNFPFWQVFRFLAPAIMAGNTAVLKHASNVSGCARAIEHLVSKSCPDFPLLKTLLIQSDKVQSIIEDPRIVAVTLTGSTAAGKAVAKVAGEHLKKTVLELGGSDPYLILQDADIALAAKKCLQSRMNNCGQSCIAAKRFMVVESVADQFIKALREEIKHYQFGDPNMPEHNLGPMARKDLRDQLHAQVISSIELGAKPITGAFIPDAIGAYYPPTLLDHVKPGMPAFDEELFGPVAAIVHCQGEEEAIALANQSPFGLGAAIFSKNIARATQLATQKIQAGNCFINDFVKSDPRLPFGGIKESGHGRELSHFGIQEFVNIKTISQA